LNEADIVDECNGLNEIQEGWTLNLAYDLKKGSSRLLADELPTQRGGRSTGAPNFFEVEKARPATQSGLHAEGKHQR
jgi:hypothetical protein